MAISSDGNQVKFSCGSEGVFVIDGQYASQLCHPTYKYPNQARFYLGVSKVTFLNSLIVGKMCNLFNYTCNEIVSIEDYIIVIKHKPNK